MLEHAPDKLDTQKVQAADSRFFYIPKSPNESLGQRIVGASAAFLEFYKQTLPTKPLEVAQAHYTPGGSLARVDPMSGQKPILTVRFSGQNPQTANDVWRLTVCHENFRDEYSLQSQGCRLHFQKSKFDAQGRLESISIEDDALSIWDTIEAMLGTQACDDKMRKVGSNRHKDAVEGIGVGKKVLQSVRIVPPIVQLEPLVQKSPEDIRLEAKSFMATFDAAIQTARAAKAELDSLLPSTSDFYAYRSLLMEAIQRQHSGEPMTTYDAKFFGNIDKLISDAGLEADKTSVMDRYTRWYAAPQVLQAAMHSQGELLEVNERPYGTLYVDMLDREVLYQLVDGYKVLFCEHLPKASHTRLAGIIEKKLLIEDWLTLAV